MEKMGRNIVSGVVVTVLSTLILAYCFGIGGPSDSSGPSLDDLDLDGLLPDPDEFDDSDPGPEPYTDEFQPSAPLVGSHCCDLFGNSRCALPQPVLLGSSCFCFGQGSGVVCR